MVWTNQIIGGVLAASMLILGSVEVLGQETTPGTSASTTQSDSSNLIWFKDNRRTEDGQVLLPWRNIVRTWPVTCDEWTQDETRRIVIYTVFAPDMFMVQTPQEGKWSVDKVYTIDPHELHLSRGWRKTLKVSLNVGKGRPVGLIEHEGECFDKLKGLPAVLLERKAWGVEAIRYSMTVNAAKLELQPTITQDARGNTVKSREHIATVELSETLWSSVKREWFDMLDMLSILIGIGIGSVAGWFMRYVKRWRQEHL